MTEAKAITCPVCENVCSSQAVACPKCGDPIQQTPAVVRIKPGPEQTDAGGGLRKLNIRQLISPLAAAFSLLCYMLPFFSITNLLDQTTTGSGVGLLLSAQGYRLLPGFSLSFVIVILPFLLKNRQGKIIIIVSSAICVLSTVYTGILMYQQLHNYNLTRNSIGFGYYGVLLGNIVAFLGAFFLTTTLRDFSPTRKAEH